MDFASPKIYLGELNDTILGAFRLACSDLGLVAVEWADSQPTLWAYLLHRLANPMPFVIACQRVIGRDGKLHGYGGGKGLQTKEWLLQMEGALIA